MDAQQIMAIIGGVTATGIVSWLVGRHLSVPGRVAKLEQDFKARGELADERYVRRVGTADSPGFASLERRVSEIEVRAGREPESVVDLQARVRALETWRVNGHGEGRK